MQMKKGLLILAIPTKEKLKYNILHHQELE